MVARVHQEQYVGSRPCTQDALCSPTLPQTPPPPGLGALAALQGAPLLRKEGLEPDK